MPRGSAVIRYDGKRGTVWRIKYRDATGRQIKETLGPEGDGWTRQKSDAELRERLVRVEGRNYRRPAPLTFGEYAERWFTEGEEAGLEAEHDARRSLHQAQAARPLRRRVARGDSTTTRG
jgi:hypothetical protein